MCVAGCTKPSLQLAAALAGSAALSELAVEAVGMIEAARRLAAGSCTFKTTRQTFSSATVLVEQRI